MTEEKQDLDRADNRLNTSADTYIRGWEIESLEYVSAGEQADADSPVGHLPTDQTRLCISLSGEHTSPLILLGSSAERAWAAFMTQPQTIGQLQMNRFARPLTNRSRRGLEKDRASSDERIIHPSVDLVRRYALGVAASERQRDLLRRHIESCEHCDCIVRGYGRR